MAAKKIVYGVNDKPPAWFTVVGGFQHVLTLFGATTLVPLIFGPAIGLDTVQIGVFISSVYFAMGIATLLQTFWVGSLLPIVQGSSFSFIPPVMVIINTVKGTGGDAKAIMAAIAGALILGGIVEALIGYSRLVGYVKKIITPVVIGPVIMIIGFGLAGVAFGAASTNWLLSILVVVLIFIFSLVVKNEKINVISVLFAVVIGYLVALLGTTIGLFKMGNPAFVNLAPIVDAKWINFPIPFRYGVTFNIGFFFAILAAYFASIIESIGDYHSISYASGLKDPTPNTISRGIGSEGLGCIISGIFGGVGATSYTENIGLVNITGVASRYVVGAGAIILILMSLIGKFGTLIATIPTPVIGGAYIALFGVIGGLGIQVLARADLKSQRNIMIVGISILAGLGLPGVISNNPLVFPPKVLADIINSILRTGMAVAGIVAIILDQLMPGTHAERGIEEVATEVMEEAAGIKKG